MPPIREDLLHALYTSSVEVPAWVRFARLACELLPCDQAAVMITPDAAVAPVGSFANEQAVPLLSALAARHADTARDGHAMLHQTDKGTALILSAVGPRQSWAHIVLWREGASASFDAELQALVETLAAPLRGSLSIFYVNVDQVRQRALADIALESSRIGVALVGENGDVLIANSITRQFLDAKDGLLLVNGHLRAEKPAETQALLDEIRRCAGDQQPEVNTGIYRPLAFTRRDHALPLTAVVRPGPGYSPLPRPLQRTAILVLRDPAQQAPWPAEALARLFGISTAEANLASELAKGASLDEASATLGISRNTARTQLKSIFLKTGINRQSDLIRALLNSGASST